MYFLSKCCCLCLKSLDNLHLIDLDMASKLSYCTDEFDALNNLVPKYACIPCTQELDIAYEFQLKCLSKVNNNLKQQTKDERCALNPFRLAGSQNCCICFKKASNLENVDIIKLLFCTNQKNKIRTFTGNCICKLCLKKLDTAYKFKLRCSKSVLQINSYVFQLQTASEYKIKEFDELQVAVVDLKHYEINLDSCGEIEELFKDNHIKGDGNPEGRDTPKVELNTCGMEYSDSEVPVDSLQLKIRCNEYLKGNPRIQSTLRTYECSTCKLKFNQESDLNTHMIIHSNNSLTPKNYPEVVSTNSSFEKCFAEHILNYKNTCPFGRNACENKCTCKHVLKRYNALGHLRDTVYSCSICGKKFKTLYKMEKHVVLHASNDFKCCSVCNIFYTGENHIHTPPPNTEPKVVCIYGTSSQNEQDPEINLMAHMIAKDADLSSSIQNSEQTTLPTQTMNADCNFSMESEDFSILAVCSLCKKKCKSSQDLINHMQIHTGIKSLLMSTEI